MLKTSKTQKQVRRLTVNKTTLRVLTEGQISHVNGGNGHGEVTTSPSQDVECDFPILLTPMCP
jgi:hypothetical protein